MTLVLRNDLDSYGVVGDPVEHSLSPMIHEAFARQFAQEISYQKFHVTPANLADFVRDFAAAGGKGLNVTVPHKGRAYALVDRRNEFAERAGAVNTISVNSGGETFGCNTDGVGLVRDIISRHGQPLEGKSILLLGAGGAAQGVVAPILAQQPARLTIANRTVEKAQEVLQQNVDAAGASVTSVMGFDELAQAPGASADVIINATSMGLAGARVPLPAGAADGAFCYDMSYGAAALFAAWAEANGASSSVDGLGMLVEQAAESYSIWRGCYPETEPVFRMLRAQLAAGA